MDNFFLMFLADTYTCPILYMSYFGVTGGVSCGFQSQSGFCLICFCRGECNEHSLGSISSATPANLLTASITAGNFPTCISRGGGWLRSGNHLHGRRTCYHCASDPALDGKNLSIGLNVIDSPLVLHPMEKNLV